MAEKLNFIIEFEASQQALKGIRRDLKRQLENLDIDINPKVQRTATRGTTSQIARASSEINSEVERLQKLQARAIQRYNSAQEKLNAATERSAALTASGATETESGRKEITSLNRSIGQLNRVLRQSAEEVFNLNPVIGNLAAIADGATRTLEEFSKGATAEGLPAVLSLLEEEVKKTPEKFETIVGRGSPVNINRTLDLFAAKIERDVIPAFGNLELTAAQQSQIFRVAIGRLAERIQDSGFTLPESEFGELSRESELLTTRERALSASVERLKRVTDDRVRSVEGGIAREGRGRGLGSRGGAATRIQEQASAATRELADSFRERAAAIRALQVEEIVSPALLRFADRLEQSADELEITSRPLVAVGERARDLAIRFGGAANDILKGIFPDATKKQLSDSAKRLADIFTEQGGNIPAAIKAFVDSTEGASADARQQSEFSKSLQSALNEAAKSTVELKNSEKQFADSLRGAGSSILQQTAKQELGKATSEFKKTVAEVVKNLRGAGTRSADLFSTGDVSDLRSALASLRDDFATALNVDEFKFLQSAGVDVNAVLGPALKQVEKVFTEEFTKQAKNIGNKLDKEALDGAKEFAKNIADASKGASEQLDPTFLQNALEDITREFPRLSEELISSITTPLRRQVENAVNSRKGADEKIKKIRDDQASAEQELLERINNQFEGENLRKVLERSLVADVKDALGNKLKNAVGGLVNAFNRTENRILQDSFAIQDAENELIAAITADFEAVTRDAQNVERRANINRAVIEELDTRRSDLQRSNANWRAAADALEQAIQDSAGDFGGDDAELQALQDGLENAIGQQASIANQLARIARDRLQVQQDLANDESNLSDIDRELAEIHESILDSARRRDAASDAIARVDEQQARRTSAGRDNRVGGEGPLRQFDVESITNFGQSLDLSSQEKFVSLLRQEDANLGTVNTQLKAHQGNLNKSNSLVERLTINLTSGQKAAFQFGFAAANAADRLLAWASPAALIFSATASLREAVDQIVRIDEATTRIAFFSPETLDRAAAGINRLGGSFNSLGASADNIVGSFNRLNSVSEQYIAITRAAEIVQKNLIQRSRETGVEIDKLSEIVLVAGRVNREAFGETGQLNPFAGAVEGLLRLEGPLGNAEKLTGDLNSVLNQFQVSGQGATLVAAQLAEVSQRSAFGVGELAEGLTRAGGALSAVQGATVAQSLELLAAASNSAQTSVSRTSTALRQLSIGVASSVDEIKEFSGLNIVEDGQLRGPEALVEVLDVINSFQGEAAAIDFISEFTDERNASVILGLARNVDSLKDSFQVFGDEATQQAKQIATLRKFFAQQEAATRTVTAEFEKLSASVTSLVDDSGVVDFMADFVRVTNTATGGIGSFVGAIGGVGPLLIGGLVAAVPLLSQVAKGFAAGLLPSQKLKEVQQQISTSLAEENNVIKAVNLARAEGLITEQQAKQFRDENIRTTASLVVGEQQLAAVKLEIAVLNQDEVTDADELRRLTQRQLVLEESIVAAKAQQKATQTAINSEVEKSSGASGLFSPRNLGRFKQGLFAVLTTAGVAAAGPIGDAIGGETGEQVSGALKGAISGAAIGAIFGPVGIGLGIIAGALGNILLTQNRIREQAEQEQKIRNKINDTIAREKREAAARDEEQLINKNKIAERDRLRIELQKELIDLDIRIRNIGQEQAEAEGLINARSSVQVRISEILLQQKKQEAAQLQEQIDFERRIADIKREQNTLSRTGGIIQDAQLAILDRTRTISPVIEARITAEADQRALDIEKQAIQRELSEVEVRLVAARQQRLDDQTIQKLEKDRLALQNTLADKEFDVIEKRLAAAQQELSAREAVADAEADRFKNITGAANETIKNLVTSQINVVELIGQEADKFADILNIRDEATQNAARITGGGAVRDITDLNVRQQKQIIAQRNQIIIDGAKRTSELLRRQFSELGDTPTFDELSSSADSLKIQIEATGGVFGRFRDGLDRSAQLQLDTVEAGKQLFEIQKSQTLSNIRLQKSAVDAENEVSRKKIGLINEELEVLQRRIDKEAQIGEKLISAPDEFIKETRRVFEAQNVLRAARVDSSNVEQGLLNIITQINRVAGPEALQPLLEGFKAAEDRNVSLVEGVLPAQLTSLFTRLVVNPNAKIQEEVASEQERLITEIGTLLSGIENNNKQVIGLIKTEQEIEKLLRDDTTPKAQLVELKNNVAASRAGAQAAIANVNVSRTELNRVGTQIIGLKSTFDAKILQESDGEKKIVSSLSVVQSLLAEIRDAREVSVGGEPTTIARVRDQLESLRGGSVPAELKDAFASALESERLKAERTRRPDKETARGLQEQLAKFDEISAELKALNTETSGGLLALSALPGVLPGLAAAPGGVGDTLLATIAQLPERISATIAGRTNEAGDFALTDEEQASVKKLVEQLEEVRGRLAESSFTPEELEKQFKAKFIEKESGRLEEILKGAGQNVGAAANELSSNIAKAGDDIRSGATNISGATINANGTVNLPSAATTAIQASSDTQVRAANKSFDAACENLKAAERLLEVAGEQSAAATAQTAATAAQTSGPGLSDIASASAEVGAGVVETMQNLRQFGLTISQILDDKLDIGSEDFFDEFDSIVEKFGLNANAIAIQAGERRSEFGGGSRGFREALIQTLGEKLDKLDDTEGFERLARQIVDPFGSLQDSQDALAKSVEGFSVENLRADDPKVISDLLNGPLARQIASMEAILSRGGLDAGTQKVLEQQLNQARADFSLRQGDTRSIDDAFLEAKRKEAESFKPEVQITAGLDRYLPIIQSDTADQKKLQQEQKKEAKSDSQKNTEAIIENVNESKKIVTKLEESKKELQQIRTDQKAQFDTQQRQTQELAGIQAKLEIDEASRQEFIDQFGQKFNEACQLWVQQFKTALEEGTLDVLVDPVEVTLQGQVETVINGDSFAQQLRDALIGTGLEDRVDDIQNALSELLELEQARSGRVGNGGVRVLDGASSRNSTRTRTRAQQNAIRRGQSSGPGIN